jgi:DNA-binding GntR family transcriptional regulator
MTGRRRTLRERAYDEIKQQFMTLELKPGEPIDDLRMSEELGVSRTPVREALFHLASEGLVLVHAGGFTVRPLDLLDISSLFEAHVVAARSIARLVAVRCRPDDLAQLRTAEDQVARAIDKRRPADIAAANAVLHRLEAKMARNDYLATLAGSIPDQGQRLGYLAFGSVNRWDPIQDHFARVREDHLEQIAAYEAGDPDAAEEIAGRHVHLFRSRILDFMSAGESDQVSLGGDVLPAIALPADSVRSRRASGSSAEA